MTDKEALKLALEALELNCYSQTESPATKAMAAIREALAEQPAQQQEPLNRLDVACDIKTLCANGDLPDSFEEIADWIASGSMPAQQQEPVAWTSWRELAGARHYGTSGWVMHAHKRSDEDIPLYTFPPASKPLTDEEWEELADRYGVVLWRPLKSDVEAKLREKNA